MRSVGLLFFGFTFAASGANLVLDYNFSLEPSDGASVLSGPFSSGSPWTVTSVGAPQGVTRQPLPAFLNAPLDPTSGSVAEAAFFFDDFGTDTLFQSIPVVAGTTYDVAFDVYQTYYGAAFNSLDVQFSASLGGTPITSFAVSSLPVPQAPDDTTAWTRLSFPGAYTAVATGNVDLSFTFTAPSTNQGGAKDIMLDMVQVTAQASPVPEPATMVLLASGFLALVVHCRKLRALR
jgi:hypothetical protein